MTAALELLPQLQAAIAAAEAATARLRTQLELVITQARSEGLSALPASIRRLACERRQANAVRGDRSQGDRSVLSAIPASVRHREWRRRQAAAKKAAIDPDRSPPLDLQPVITGEATAGGVLRTDRIPPGTHGPLAGDVASLVGRVTGYAESTRKRDLAWLYEEATRIFRGELGLRLPERWSGPKDWGAAKVLIRDYKREQLLEAIRAACKGWKPSAKYPTRPTLGLVLFQLRRDRAAAPAPDSRRLTGEQLDERDRARARAAAAPTMKGAASPRAGEIALAQRDEPRQGAALGAPAGANPANPTSPTAPIGPRDLRGTPPGEVRGKIAEILEQLEERGGGP